MKDELFLVLAALTTTALAFAHNRAHLDDSWALSPSLPNEEDIQSVKALTNDFLRHLYADQYNRNNSAESEPLNISTTANLGDYEQSNYSLDSSNVTENGSLIVDLYEDPLDDPFNSLANYEDPFQPSGKELDLDFPDGLEPGPEANHSSERFSFEPPDEFVPAEREHRGFIDTHRPQMRTYELEIPRRPIESAQVRQEPPIVPAEPVDSELPADIPPFNVEVPVREREESTVGPVDIVAPSVRFPEAVASYRQWLDSLTEAQRAAVVQTHYSESDYDSSFFGKASQAPERQTVAVSLDSIKPTAPTELEASRTPSEFVESNAPPIIHFPSKQVTREPEKPLASSSASPILLPPEEYEFDKGNYVGPSEEAGARDLYTKQLRMRIVQGLQRLYTIKQWLSELPPQPRSIMDTIRVRVAYIEEGLDLLRRRLAAAELKARNKKPAAETGAEVENVKEKAQIAQTHTGPDRRFFASFA